jgi:hypothetical protein
MPENKLPNFIIVGAAKSGTTSMWKYLNEHPEVFMSKKKEPLFFISKFISTLNPDQTDCKYLIDNTVHNLSEYKKLFTEATNEKALGEASVGYLSYADIAIPKIKKILGDIKIIMILRNPIERAFSAFTHQTLLGNESLTFELALEKELEREKENPALYYIRNGYYTDSVKAYLDNFTNVKIYLFDDLKNNINMVINDLLVFLCVDSNFQADTGKKHNISGVPKNKIIQHLLNKPYLYRSLIPLIRPIYKTILSEKMRYQTIPNIISGLKKRNINKTMMRSETRQKLKIIYKKEIMDLQVLLDRDLSHWLV